MSARIFWKDAEYVTVFNAMLAYFTANKRLPALGPKNYELFAQFEKGLPPVRRRTVNSNFVFMIGKAFHAWRINPNPAYWRAQAQLTLRDKNVAHHGPVTITTPVAALPAPKPVEEVTTPANLAQEVKALFSQMESVFIERLTPLFMRTSVAKAIEAPVQEQPARPAVIKVVAPLVTVLAPEEKPLVQEAEPAPVLPEAPASISALSEADVRRIVRDEIEKIFGSIEPAPKKEAKAAVVKAVEPRPVLVLKTPAAPPVKAAEPISILTLEKPAPYVPRKKVAPPMVLKEPEQIRVLVYGLKEVQLATVAAAAPAHVKVEGSDTFSQSTKDLARSCKFVIVSRFCKHATYNTLRGMFGDKVIFASGGVSMIKAKMLELVNQSAALV